MAGREAEHPAASRGGLGHEEAVLVAGRDGALGQQCREVVVEGEGGRVGRVALAVRPEVAGAEVARGVVPGPVLGGLVLDLPLPGPLQPVGGAQHPLVEERVVPAVGRLQGGGHRRCLGRAPRLDGLARSCHRADAPDPPGRLRAESFRAKLAPTCRDAPGAKGQEGRPCRCTSTVARPVGAGSRSFAASARDPRGWRAPSAGGRGREGVLDLRGLGRGRRQWRRLLLDLQPLHLRLGAWPPVGRPQSPCYSGRSDGSRLPPPHDRERRGSRPRGARGRRRVARRARPRHHRPRHARRLSLAGRRGVRRGPPARRPAHGRDRAGRRPRRARGPPARPRPGPRLPRPRRPPRLRSRRAPRAGTRRSWPSSASASGRTPSARRTSSSPAGTRSCGPTSSARWWRAAASPRTSTAGSGFTRTSGTGVRVPKPGDGRGDRDGPRRRRRGRPRAPRLLLEGRLPDPRGARGAARARTRRRRARLPLRLQLAGAVRERRRGALHLGAAGGGERLSACASPAAATRTARPTSTASTARPRPERERKAHVERCVGPSGAACHRWP